MTVHERLKSMGIALPPAPRPVAAVQCGNLVYISGQLPLADGQLLATGPVPSQVAVERAQHAARQCALNALAVLADQIGGNLDQVQQIVRIGVFVCCSADFTQQPAIANGASELLVEIFGERGRHARAAVGSISLPLGATVELEMIASVV